MDFDPGFHEEMYDEGYDDGQEEAEEDTPDDAEETIEHDGMGNAVYLASAAGFGYHMALDEIEERKLAEDILRRREGKPGKPVKVPLARRHEVKGHTTPFGRWAAKVAHDPKRREDELEYTKEEQDQILKAEGEGWPTYD